MYSTYDMKLHFSVQKVNFQSQMDESAQKVMQDYTKFDQGLAVIPINLPTSVDQSIVGQISTKVNGICQLRRIQTDGFLYKES